MCKISYCSISNVLTIADAYLDYIPVISTLTNLINIFQKYIVRPLLEPATQKSRYYQHIHAKKCSYCLLLLIPVLGNIIVPLLKYRNQQNKKTDQEPLQKSASLESGAVFPKGIKKPPCQVVQSVILNEANLPQYEKGEEGRNFSQITKIDEALFLSLDNDKIHSILEKCMNVVIEVTCKEVPYYIPASTLLSAPFFARMLFGSFKERNSLIYQDNQIQFRLPDFQELQVNIPLYLEALEVVHTESFQSWSLLSLAKAYLGADYSIDEKMKEDLLSVISLKEMASNEEMSCIIEFLLSIGEFPFNNNLDFLGKLKRQLFYKCLQYDLLCSKAPIESSFYERYGKQLESLELIQEEGVYFQKIDTGRLIQITNSLPNLKQLLVADGYEFELKGLERIFTETLLEITLNKIVFTQEQLIDLIEKLGIIKNSELSYVQLRSLLI